MSSEPRTSGSQIYTGECSDCEKNLKRTLPANAGNIKSKGPIRVYCSECRAITEIPQTGTN